MIWIEWVEPFDKAGNVVYMRVARNVAIAAQREAAGAYSYPDDETALADFVDVHWAKVIEEKAE